MKTIAIGNEVYRISNRLFNEIEDSDDYFDNIKDEAEKLHERFYNSEIPLQKVADKIRKLYKPILILDQAILMNEFI